MLGKDRVLFIKWMLFQSKTVGTEWRTTTHAHTQLIKGKLGLSVLIQSTTHHNIRVLTDLFKIVK